MNLEKFKPAWNQIKAINQLDQLSLAELDLIIGSIESDAGAPAPALWKRVMLHAALYSLLVILCQG